MAPTTSTKVLASFLLCMTLLQGITCGKVWIVGDKKGWDYHIFTWTFGKTFKTGDQLVFKYNPFAHDVTPVSAIEFQECRKLRTTRTFRTGSEKIVVKRGWNYFISTVVDDCEQGIQMRLYGY